MMNDVLICVNGSMIFTNYFPNVYDRSMWGEKTCGQRLGKDL